MRHDTLLTRVGDRGSRNLSYIFIEETKYERLERNNFRPGTAFNVQRRPGTGLVIQQALLSNNHVSERNGRGVLSYEAKDLKDFLGCLDVRVRISVGQITVVPRLRLAAIHVPATEVWTIKGANLTTPAGSIDLLSPKPLMLRSRAGTIEAALDAQNLVFATELIGNQRPGRVVVTGEPVMVTVAGQFLAACGYGPGELPGEFRR